MYPGVGKYYSGFGRIFYGVLGTATFTGEPTNRAWLVVPLKRLNVFNIERFDEQVVQPEQRQRVFHLEAVHKCLNTHVKLKHYLTRLSTYLDEIRSFLQICYVLGLRARPDLDVSCA